MASNFNSSILVLKFNLSFLFYGNHLAFNIIIIIPYLGIKKTKKIA